MILPVGGSSLPWWWFGEGVSWTTPGCVSTCSSRTGCVIQSAPVNHWAPVNQQSPENYCTPTSHLQVKPPGQL